MDGKHKLQQLKLVVDELHSRRDDGLNDFGRDEPAIGRLVRALDGLLGQGDAWPFLTSALQTVKASSLVLDTMKRVESRNLATPEDSFRVWILFALSTPGALLGTLQEVLKLSDLVECFFGPTSPLCDAHFIDALLPVIASIFAHPLHGQITFKLDVSCLPLFTAQEEIVAVRRRATTVAKAKTVVAAPGTAAATAAAPKPKRAVPRPVAPGSPSADSDASLVMHDTASESVGPSSIPSSVHVDPLPAPASEEPLAATAPAATLSHHPSVHHVHHVLRPKSPAPVVVKPVTSEASCQTDPLPPEAPPKAPTSSAETNTEEREPVSYAELKRLEKLLLEREKINVETRARLEKQEEEVEDIREDLNDQLDNVTAALKNLKNLYNHHFMVVKDSQDSGKPIDRARVDVLFPRILAVLNGADPTAPAVAQPASAQMSKSASFAVPRGGVTGRGARDEDTDSSESAVMVGSGGTLLASSNEQSPKGAAASMHRTASFMSTASEPASGRLRSDSVAGESRQRAMSVLPAPDTAPALSKGKRPWRIELLAEVERTKQLDLQQYQCAGCKKDLPNPNKSNFFAKAIQRTQKPRRCHYSGELFCHDCHSNKKHALPFLVVQNWDFTEEHVSNVDYDFLVERWSKPMLHVSELPSHIQTRPLFAQAAKVRHLLSKMYAVMYTCPDARTAFGARLAHYYFLNESFYSMNDLQSIKNREDAEAGRGGGVARMVLGNQGVDVLAALDTLAAEARDHILKHCQMCSSSAMRRCTLCGDGDPVVMFENGAECPGCHSPFHQACLGLGCPKCEHH